MNILPRLVRVIVDQLGSNLTLQDLQGAARFDDVTPMDSLGTLKFALGIEREFGLRLDREFFNRELLLDIARLTTYLEQRSQPESP